MESLFQDVKFGIRVLTKSPGFTAIAVLALALGIGANSAIFSVVNAVLLAPLPYKNPDGLLRISTANLQKGIPDLPFSYNRWMMMRDRNQSLQGLAAYTGDAFNLISGGEPEQILGARVSYTVLQVLGVKPIIGRDFLPEEDNPGGNHVVIIGYALWQRRFAADPNIIGKPVNIDSKIYTVVGVMDKDFRFPFDQAELWVPNVSDVGFLTPDQVQRGAGYLNAVARLKPGVTMAQGLPEMESISRAYRTEFPNGIDADPNGTMRVISFKEQIVQNVKLTLLVLLASVAFVLLIACANVANLLLARAVSRQKEIAIRTALGATRGRIVRQLLIESVILALLGGGIGMLFAVWGVSVLARVSVNNLPRAEYIRVDGQVLGFSLAISLLTGVIFGLVPALRASNPDLNGTLKDGGRGGSEGLARNILRNTLVVAEVALSVILLIGAGLLIQSFARLQKVQVGANMHNVLTLAVTLPQSKYPERRNRSDFADQVVQKIKTLPGVKYAAMTLSLPLNGSPLAPLQVEGRPPVPVGERPLVELQSITGEYFRVMGIPLLSGREFNDHDMENSQRVMIISNMLAKTYFPNENPVGKFVNLGSLPTNSQIVGVVGDVRTNGLNADPGAMAYMCNSQRAQSGFFFAVRTEGDPLTMARPITEQILSVDKDLPVTAVQSLEQIASASVAQPRITMFLLGIFALLALLIASIGIYGVLSYSVKQRTQEIGIRMSLGASPSSVLRLVLGRALMLSSIGIGIGLVVAVCLSWVMNSLLYGVGARDPITFIGVSVFLTAIAMFASYLPARRASKVDPLEAMRY